MLWYVLAFTYYYHTLHGHKYVDARLLHLYVIVTHVPPKTMCLLFRGRLPLIAGASVRSGLCSGQSKEIVIGNCVVCIYHHVLSDNGYYCTTKAVKTALFTLLSPFLFINLHIHEQLRQQALKLIRKHENFEKILIVQ
uniref:Uncharacterized protein n=1 Tax=Dicentrarchus labrax TaxID=13489 RepID=A0A8C4GEY2_DICLA